MQLGVLGPPRLFVDGDELHVGSRKALALLAWLALEGGATRERLAAMLWPDADGAAARRNLRRELFRLRELGVPLAEAADGVVSLDGAFSMAEHADGSNAIGPDAAGAVDDGATDGLATTRQARWLDGLDGLGSAEFDARLQDWRSRLTSRRGETLLRQAAAREHHGDKVGALALHAQRWSADACDESAAAEVIRLHAELGQHALALQAYRRLSETLRRELDLAPSASAKALLLAIRGRSDAEDDPAAATSRDRASPAVTAPVQLLPTVIPFLPRVDVARRIEAAWSRGQRVYLHGPPGSGKSRLASELASRRGAWLRVACEPQDAELPYASVVRLLRALRESAPDVRLPDWVRRELSQLMPELGDPPHALATDEARQRLLAAATATWRLLMHDNFNALVLDDWHWSDAASVALWSQLDGPSADGGSCAWIVAYRSGRLSTAAAARERGDIDGGRAEAIGLEGLEPAEVLDLTRRLSGSGGGRLFSQRLHQATGGNPFFLLETLRHLAEQGLLVAEAGGWSTPFDEKTERYDELPVPSSVRAAVLARVRALGPDVHRLLEVAALVAGPIDTALVAAAGGFAEADAIGWLERAEAAQLVASTGGECRFAHDLVRQSLLQALSAPRQRLLHERLAKEQVAAGTEAAIIAAHWEQAARPAKAIPWRVAAGEAALRVHALDEALMHHTQAIADGATGVVAARIHRSLAGVHARRTDRAAVDAAFAAGVAAAAGDADGRAAQLAVVGIWLDQAAHLAETDRLDEAEMLIGSLAGDLAGAGPAERARAAAIRGAALMLRGRHAQALALQEEALALLEPLPESRHQLGALLLDMARAAMRRGDLVSGGTLAQRASAVHDSVDALAGMSQAMTLLGCVENALGRASDGLRRFDRARVLAARCGNVPAQRSAILNLVKFHTDQGDADAAAALLDEGEALAPGFEHQRAEQAFRDARFYVHFIRGEVGPARAAAERVRAFAAGLGPHERLSALLAIVELPLLEGDTERAGSIVAEARALVEAMAANGESTIYTHQHAVRCAWLALVGGRPADALAALPRPERFDRIEDRFGVAWIGAAALRATGDLPSARLHLDSVSIDDEVAIDHMAPWLEQRLRIAAESGCDDPEALRRAEELLASRRVPKLHAVRLADAVAGLPQRAATAPG